MTFINMSVNLRKQEVAKMQLIETMFMLAESFLHLAVGLMKFFVAMYLLVFIISNPLIFLFVVLFCPGVLTFALSLMLMSSGSGRR